MIRVKGIQTFRILTLSLSHSLYIHIQVYIQFHNYLSVYIFDIVFCMFLIQFVINCRCSQVQNWHYPNLFAQNANAQMTYTSITANLVGTIDMRKA